MNEVTSVLLKKKLKPPENAFQAVEHFFAFGTQAVSRETVLAAILLNFETNYSCWDCMLMAAAIELGCRNFLSEDLQDGFRYRGLTVVNPFRHSPPYRASQQSASLT